MVKSQQSPIFIITNVIGMGKSKEAPPKIPPRSKKGKAPALPEKPAHMKPRPPPPSHALHRILPSGHTTEPGEASSEVLRVLQSNQLEGREVLVAASRAGRERPIERRQRQPAQLLTPTKPSSAPSPQRDKWQDTRGGTRKQHHPPILLIPRGMLPPVVSYALWAQQREGTTPMRRQIPKQQQKVQPEPRARSGSVTRSGSLTSQGSSSSDSETFPKSVLKKQKRVSVQNTSTRASCREHKKNVTFNAFATVQLMDA